VIDAIFILIGLALLVGVPAWAWWSVAREQTYYED